ncbi:hypothetical protein D9757_005793 [Collybiopsis confluens]|uniref:Amino acid transporter transmembrane domain-containing protein n=1 Tax=Collybiopsis confluens TaxID=2823264 RepID=A0A8H5MBA8_9AGAR|nr:hypothetical protein D9757_005793 [Collybiopsis confluens]
MQRPRDVFDLIPRLRHMGFFKRILSLGSKKSSSRKKQGRDSAQNAAWVDETGTRATYPVMSDEDNEIAANLLLRSSSARYAVVSETHFSSLPPLPHPINSALHTPSSSTTSLPASANLSRRGTYIVKVHPRQQHTCTEFPLANRGVADDPPPPRRRAQTVGPAATFGLADESEFTSTHLQGLRRDPSVASLLDLYDEHGQLPSKAFSNTPPKSRDGREQTRRNGSTLRELLGEPHRNTSSSLEGDISWAERFLGEANSTSASSSVSSLMLETPHSENVDSFAVSHSRFSDSLLLGHKVHATHESTFISEHNLSTSSSFMINNDPAISSMDVELSAVTDRSQISRIIDTHHPNGTENACVNLKTPRRASEVFGFLTEKKQKRKSQAVAEKDSSESGFFANTPETAAAPSASPLHNELSQSNSRDIDIFSGNIYHRTSSNQLPDSHTDSHPHAGRVDEFTINTENPSQAPRTRVIMTGPTKVTITAPTPMADGSDRPTGRIPRGPRSLDEHRRRSKSRSRRNLKDENEFRPGLIERSNAQNCSSEDPFTPVPSRPMKLRRASSSIISTDAPAVIIAKTSKKESKSRGHGSNKSLIASMKENAGLTLSATPDIPFTPIRSHSSSSVHSSKTSRSRSSPSGTGPSRRSSLLRSVVTPESFRPPKGMTPSPASSSELSPVGKRIMMDARRQRSMTQKLEGRQLSMHVNDAKEALYSFYSKTILEGQYRVAATYLVTGQVESGTDSQTRESDAMEVDSADFQEEKTVDFEDDGEEVVEMTEVVLVGERDLEIVKSKFSTVASVHVYSLSPAPIRDMGLICGPTEIVRDIDNKKGSEMAEIVGKIVGNVREAKGKYVPLPLPPPAAVSTAAASSSSVVKTASAPANSSLKKSGSISSKEKSKPKDFFANIKPKDKEPKTMKDSTKKDQPLPKEATNAKTLAKTESSLKNELDPVKKLESKSDDENNETVALASSRGKAKAPVKKAGTKRKSGLISESEEDKEEKEMKKYNSKSNIKVKRGVVVSEEEEEESEPKFSKTKSKGKGKHLVREEDEDVLAMMDIDDDQVEVVSNRASQSAFRKKPPEPSEAEAEDVQMDETKPQPKPKRKAKKVIPTGRNGLKKKRVMRKREFFDEKGYMVTEDYSDYESVDENAGASKGKGREESDSSDKPTKKKEAAKSENAGADSDSAPMKKSKEPKAAVKPKPKASSNKRPGSGTIQTFFQRKYFYFKDTNTDFSASFPSDTFTTTEVHRRRSVSFTDRPTSNISEDFEMTNAYGTGHNPASVSGGADHEDSGEQSALLGGHSPPKVAKADGHASMVSSASNLANTIIGSGMLTFPLALASAGIIPGILTCLLSGGIAVFGLHLLTLCAAKAPYRRASFFAVAQMTFPKAAVFFDAAIAIKCFGVSISYLIIIKGLTPNVVSSLYHDLSNKEPPQWMLNGRNWLGIFMLVLIPLAFLRQLNSLRHTSYVALFSVGYLLIIVIRCYFWPLKNMPVAGEIRWVRFTSNFVSTFPVQVFAFTCAQNLFPIFNEVKNNNQSRMNIIIGSAIGSATMVYEIIAVFGYLTFGTNVGANIIAMYPSNSLFIAIGQVAIVILVLFSYPLQVHPCRNCLDKVFHAGSKHTDNEEEEAVDDHGSGAMTSTKHTVLTLAIIVSTYTIAYLVDDLKIVLSFVGSTGSTTISFILPGLFYWKMSRGDEDSRLLNRAALALAVYGMFIFVFCLGFNIYQVVHPSVSGGTAH